MYQDYLEILPFIIIIDKQTNFSFDYKYIGKKRSGNDPNYILSKSKILSACGF